MSNEHIARLQKIGFGKETTPGTTVAPTFWLPKGKGVMIPKTEFKYDEGAYGTIDKFRDGYVVRKWSELTITDTMPRDVWIGHFLKALFGTEYPCVKFTTNSITGIFVEGEVVTESVSTATGTLRRLDDGGSAKCLYLEPLAGTLTGGQTLTGGTSGATCTGGTILSPSAGRYHIFRRLNSNQPTTYTISFTDPVSGDEKAGYCVLDTFDLECKADDLVKFALKFMGQATASSSTLTPAYTSENPFLGKHLSVKLASAFTGLDAATATAMERIKLSAMKNVEMIFQADANTPPSPTMIDNTEFEMKGDFAAVFSATTIRDLALAGTPYAMRLAVINSANPITGSYYPTLQFDLPRVYFNDWSKDSDNAKIVRENIGFTATYDTTRSMTAEALLLCSRITSY